MRLSSICFAVLALAGVARGSETAVVLAPEPFALQFSPANTGATELIYAVKPGTIWQAGADQRFVTLRAAEVTVPPHATASLTVPAAALSPAALWKAGLALA